MAVPIAVRTEEVSQPILPPRQTGRMPASRASQPASWKSWPIFVIGIAVIAIIAAVILMVWPSKSAGSETKTLAPPPAPERMDTNPLPQNGPQGQVDPWKSGPSAPDPQASPKPVDPPDIDQIDPPDPNGLQNPFRGGNLGGGLGGPNAVAMITAAGKHACERLNTCPNADPTVKQLCEMGTMLPADPPPTCGAAKRCLSAIDNMPCDDIDASATMGMITSIQDCLEATSC